MGIIFSDYRYINDHNDGETIVIPHMVLENFLMYLRELVLCLVVWLGFLLVVGWKGVVFCLFCVN